MIAALTVDLDDSARVSIGVDHRNAYTTAMHRTSYCCVRSWSALDCSLFASPVLHVFDQKGAAGICWVSTTKIELIVQRSIPSMGSSKLCGRVDVRLDVTPTI